VTAAAADGWSIDWYDGPRAALRELFLLADDSVAQVDATIGRGRVLVASGADGAALAHLQLVTDDTGEPEIASLAVVERCRGRGIGRALVERALEACRADGAASVRVRTGMADVGNLRFYQRLGFRAAAIERDAFTPERGYPAGLESDGIPLLDAITLTADLAGDAQPGASRSPR
jgi:ribosomal protein S18 acetylase RimI-like enzyme